MANIPIRDIAQTGIPSATSNIVFDDGSMKRATVSDLADGVRPVASQSEAQTGSDNSKTMSPLRVKQSIASEVGVTVASKSQGDAANTALQPAAIGSTVQAYDADLAAIAGLSPANNDFLQRKSGVWTNRTPAQAKADLSLSTVATSGAYADLSGLPTLGGLAAKNKAAVADIDATGTPSSTTALFGDGTWKTPSGAGDMLKSAYDPDNVGANAFDSGNTVFKPAVTGTVATNVQERILQMGATPQDFGAVGDCVVLAGVCSIASGAATLTVTGASFTAKDVGKAITVPGAGVSGGELITTISAYTDATHITLADNAGTTLSSSSETITFGTESAAAINLALSHFDHVFIPAGSYFLKNQIALSKSNQLFQGASMSSVILYGGDTTKDCVTVATGLTGLIMGNFTVSRAVRSTSAQGIKYLGTCQDHELESIRTMAHNVGLTVGTTDASKMRNIVAEQNSTYGIYMTNASSYGPVQWQLDKIYVVRNGVDGIHVQSTAGVAGLILGEWTNVQGYANTRFGILLSGSASCPIYDFRLKTAFLGGDGDASVYVDTHGSNNIMQDVFIEENGSSATGPDLTTPATGAGIGVFIGPNEVQTRMTGGHIINCSMDALLHNGGVLQMSEFSIYDNGRAGTATRQTGINSTGGKLKVANSVIGPMNFTTQQYGIATSHDSVQLTGCDLSGNTSAPMYNSPALSASIVTGCLPKSINLP